MNFSEWPHKQLMRVYVIIPSNRMDNEELIIKKLTWHQYKQQSMTLIETYCITKQTTFLPTVIV